MPEGSKAHPFVLEESLSEDEVDAYKPAPPPQTAMKEEEEDDEEHCSICLQPLSDRTIIPACSHEFCFECLLVWTEQSRRCPLCSGQIGEYLIHDIRSKYDFSKHYLNPLRTSPRPDPPVSRVAAGTQRRRGQGRELIWGRNERRERERERRAADELERAIEKRRWIYRHNLYAMHVASNPYTRYKPFPTPAQFASNPDLISRATIFVRRELRVWDALDVEFLTTFTISLMKSIDIRSESAVKLLAEFLDMDTGERTNAEHFAHELYCYLRSPYRDLTRYDAAVQYDTPEHVPAVEHRQRSRRWEDEGGPAFPNTSSDAGPSNAPSGSPSRSHSRLEFRDAVRERGSSKERKERSQSRRSDVQETHRVGLEDYRRSSDQGEIPGNTKGKGRAVNEDGLAELMPQSVLTQHDTGAIVSRPVEEGHSPRGNVNGTETSTSAAPLIQEDHGGSSSSSEQNDRPRVRREALQAMNAHLLSSSRGNRTSKPAIDREQQTPDTPARDELPPLTELSIRGAAKAAAQASPVPLFPSPHESNCQSPHDATRVTTDVQGMSSRDIMARTRARLAKLRQDSTLTTSTTSPKRGDHDVLGLDAPSTFPTTPHTTEDGNHTAPLTSNFSSGPIVAESHEASAAHSSHPSSATPGSDVEGATATPAASLRAKLLKKLEDEKRAHDDDQDNNPHHTDTPAAPVAAEGTQFQASRSPDNIGGSKQGQTEEELSFGRQDAEMLEKKLRGQAQLRIKLAAAKRHLAEAALADENSGVDRNPMSREEYLRSRLKRAA